MTATDPGSHSGSAAFNWTVGLVAADGTRTPGAPSYTITLTSNSTGGTWTGHESISFKNLSPTPLPEVYLRLWDNFHGTCPSDQPIQIGNVTGGTLGALEVNRTAVKITLPAALAQNQTGTVGFDVSIVVPAGSDRFGSDGAYNSVLTPTTGTADQRGHGLDRGHPRAGPPVVLRDRRRRRRVHHAVARRGLHRLRRRPLVRHLHRRRLQGGRPGGEVDRPDVVLEHAPCDRLSRPGPGLSGIADVPGPGGRRKCPI